MAQPPAVVIIARHGMRLDAANQSWHLSTPTPYDPPLTYGGWNQCRALGVRIASILHAREQSINNLPAESNENGMPKRRKKKHKVVIHTSPFLRCLQTSVAISAGMAQYEAPKARPSSARTRTAATMHSASPRMRGLDSERSPHLAPIAEPKNDFAHEMARKALYDQKRYRKSKLRVDAFLGEWLNPGYFDQITPPPPSPMMIAGAKAELLASDPVDMYTPTLSHKSSNNSLWGGGGSRAASKESTLDDWSHVTDALPAPTPRRERSNSASSVGSNESSGRKSPFRAGHALQPLTSTLPKAEPAIYHPPTPSYAISSSDYIPRGYVAHARNATVNVDYSWDSSRSPQDWGNGGSFGEEWSAMHKRFRRGLNHLIQWYSQHNADDRGEDALGFEQADKHHHGEEDEEEELVVILVTHGAGSNALIGALTNQPVLLDVGMASLTMAVRRDDAPALLSPPDSNAATPSPAGTPRQSPDPAAMMNGHRRRSSLDIGLSAVYDMKLVSSSEHLRPGADPTKAPASSIPSNLRNAQEALGRYKQFGSTAHAAAGSGIESNWNLGEPRRSNTSTAIGSIRRPSASNVPQRPSSAHNPKINPRPPPPDRISTPPTFTAGLWTPPSGRGTPKLTAQKVADDKHTLFTKLNEASGGQSPGKDMTLNFAQSPPDSRPNSSNGIKPSDLLNPVDGTVDRRPSPKQQDSVITESDDDLGDLPSVSDKLPTSLSRGLSQKGLWGSRPSGDKVPRKFAKEMPKRRWTTHEND
ncbi:hypothetical protein M409DRAFT_64530 [Zasmidium cellare ATCC 36951]|uniref:Phosphoglycerate mutase family protein n=1 Tax=Zasmidium cellare ATCC 36951 TaxID=1080233 RepID=A0A6A6CT00_ZASCE|nr:uncharacterized protein M409DRAFT_64530 [Zasmidium cellare ATCC 36951]KAF2170195.1 hypothetical protein M409DRAFT_64530 [Zasmidium cellare ATCC 36951]